MWPMAFDAELGLQPGLLWATQCLGRVSLGLRGAMNATSDPHTFYSELNSTGSAVRDLGSGLKEAVFSLNATTLDPGLNTTFDPGLNTTSFYPTSFNLNPDFAAPAYASEIHIRGDCRGCMCFSVQVPDRPFQVCMQCTNPLPANSEYVYTANWFLTKRCDTRCLAGFGGAPCVPVAAAQPMMWPLVVSVTVLTLSALLLLLYITGRRAPSPPPEPEEPPPPLTSSMVQFRDDVITHQHIRVKIH